MLDKHKIIKTLNLVEFGQKGWLHSDLIECPDCHKNDKIGILFVKNSGIVKCMRCGFSTNLNHFLWENGWKELVTNEKRVSERQELPNIFEKDQQEKKEIKEIKRPIGFKQIDFDEYLEKRKFIQYHYKVFTPGITKLIPSLRRNYLIFLLYQNKKLVGWLARSKKSKEWHKRNLKLAKQKKASLQLRWKNSSETNFSAILGGYDEITDKTDIAILVEGLFDKTSVDKLIEPWNQNYIRCLFTFGDSIGTEQIELLKKKRSINSIFLLYDYNTIKESKSAAMQLQRYFNTYVCDIKRDADPGQLNEKEIQILLSNSKQAIDYYTNKLKRLNL